MHGAGASPESGQRPFENAATRRERCALHQCAEARRRCAYPTSAISTCVVFFLLFFFFFFLFSSSSSFLILILLPLLSLLLFLLPFFFFFFFFLSSSPLLAASRAALNGINQNDVVLVCLGPKRCRFVPI